MEEHEPERRAWREGDAVFLQHLESRRQALDEAMWQAPALTIAAQAFVLLVLTDDTVTRGVRSAVLVAAVLTSLASAVSLLRLRSREALYSEAIGAYCREFGLRDPRPSALYRTPSPARGPWARTDLRLRALLSMRWLPPVYWFWLFALGAFVVADFVALLWA